jgi:3'-phosphoadenosine 5'-phosphosulfate (PAPS) 3'-phosphatase
MSSNGNGGVDAIITNDPDIDMVVLLSTCIDACRRGCEVIRNVRHRMMHNNNNNNNNTTESLFYDTVLYKIPDDPRSALTEADGASQKVIIECLTSIWAHEIKIGRIKIVGEEEDDHSTDLDDEGDNSFDTAFSEDINIHFDDYNCPRPNYEPIITDMFNMTMDNNQLSPPPSTTYYQHGNNNRTTRVNNNSSIDDDDDDDGDGEYCCTTTTTSTTTPEIIIFIDPMDGTREFVEGRIQNVQCLIGITYNGIPVAGAMGLPMVHETQIEIAYGLISTKIMKKKKKKKKKKKDDNNDNVDDDGTLDEIVPVPVLSGIKLFDAHNPLVRNTSNTSTTTGDSSKSDNVDDENDNSSSSDDTLLLFSGDSMKPSLNLAMECLENKVLCDKSGEDCNEALDNRRESIDECHLHPSIRKVIVGGCGHKILSVQRHVQSLVQQQQQLQTQTLCNGLSSSSSTQAIIIGAISLAPPGSSSWDTAAPTAVLLAADPKAKVTDLLGRPLIYDGDNLSNNCGVVASSGTVATIIHDRLCRELCNDGILQELICVNINDDDNVVLSSEIQNPPSELEIVRSLSDFDRDRYFDI